MSKHFRGKGSPRSLVALAIWVGVLVGFGLSTIGYGAKFQFLGQSLLAQTILSEQVVWPDQNPAQRPSPDDEHYLDYLADMVSKTNGFYARDYSLSLGWNNIRYIIETALVHGRILNRTTIIPSFVYARACEFDLSTCAAYATMVNRGDAANVDDWRDLPIEQQMAWRLPIYLMFNVSHLQQTHSVITTSDYLRLHNISADLESSDGLWDADTYHVPDATGALTPSLHAVEYDWYDSGYMVRVDRIPNDMRARGRWTETGGSHSRDQMGSWTESKLDSEIYHALTEVTPMDNPVVPWSDVRRVLEDGNRITSASSVEVIGDVLRENGYEVVYTYHGGQGSGKQVVLPMYKAVPRRAIRGLYEDFYHISDRVLLIHGELHLEYRRPGSLYFTTTASRERYSRTVLYDIRIVDDVLALAERISERMYAVSGGRLWMAAHMRRGDFARLGWAIEADFATHLARIKRHLQSGRETLVSMHGRNASAYDVPDARPDSSLVTLAPPNPDDKYYIATDERDPENLKYLRDQGAILISDLLTKEDHRDFGWPILLTDVLALVEQSIMARAGYFYAHGLSSVAGGVINLRAGLGKDPRTAVLD